MTGLQVKDLRQSRELDEQAYREICGGWAGFLSGLYAPAGGSFPGITNNLFVDLNYTQNIFQQNPVNMAFNVGDGSIVDIGSINVTPVSANSPMNLIFGAGSAI